MEPNVHVSQTAVERIGRLFLKRISDGVTFSVRTRLKSQNVDVNGLTALHMLYYSAVSQS